MSELHDTRESESRSRQMLGLAVVLAVQALTWFAIGFYACEWMH